MQLPDVTLRAGSYIFKVLDSSVIQVTSTDRSYVYTMFFTSPVQRPDDSHGYAITVLPRGDMAPMVTQLFLGHRALGFEPIYPSDDTRSGR